MVQAAVLIPHHARRELLSPLFTSLLNMEMPPEQVQILLVDNGSQDGSVDWVHRRFPRVAILEMGSNLGYAPALNRAARTVEAEWLCFLNNDMRVDPEWLPNLLFAAKTLPSPCFASHILNWKGTQTQYAGGWINWFGKGFESTRIAAEEPYEVFFPCGGAMMIRREVFWEIGGFDEDFFMIYEDVDLGWRLQLYGYPVYLIPDAFVMHRGHASLSRESYARKAVFLERNSLAMLYKNLDLTALAGIFPLAVQDAVVRAHALGGIGYPFRYSSDGLATLTGLQAFFDLLPKWNEKREQIQKQRRISDQTIFQQFFSQSSQLWAYQEAHYRRLLTPEVEPKIQNLLQQAKFFAVGS